jgi:hypothetical protein
VAVKANQLLGMSQAELDALFSAYEAGPIPDGEAAGAAIIAPRNRLQPGDCGRDQHLRLEGLSLQRRGRFSPQRRARLRGAELTRREGMHRPRLFGDVARGLAHP